MKSTNLLTLAAIAIGSAAAALSGCAALRQHALSRIPASEAQPVLTAAFADATPRGLRYGGPQAFQSYLMYQAHGARSEMIYTRTTSPRAGIYFPHHQLRGLSEGWRFVAAADPVWGPAKQTPSALGQVHYRTFRADGSDCAAFQARWNLAAGLPAQLPTKTVFGYYCGAPGTTVTSADFNRVLGSIRPRRPDQSGAQAVARLNPRHGNGETPYGRDDFPHLFAVNSASERAQDSNH